MIVARVPEIEEALATHDLTALRAATQAAVTGGASMSDIAESIVAYSEERLLAGDTRSVDMCMFHAVHDGVPPSALFTEIKRMARIPKEE